MKMKIYNAWHCRCTKGFQKFKNTNIMEGTKTEALKAGRIVSRKQDEYILVLELLTF